MKQKKIGDSTERKCLEVLSKLGYWCHLFAYNKNGQPCDIVAMKDNIGYLIDVKHCEGDRFDFKRIEPNQRSCFIYARSCGNKTLGLMIYFEKHNCFNYLPFWAVEEMERNGEKSYKFDEGRAL